jgi:hypothetical protein
MRRAVFVLVLLSIGIAVGGYLFRNVQPRSFLALDSCGSQCYRPNDFVGLLASAGIQHASALMPLVVLESPGCITIKHPTSSAPSHFVAFPKRDIKDIASISQGDSPFVSECFEHIRQVVQQFNLSRYRVETNGPRRQHVTYLHFHIISSESNQ